MTDLREELARAIAEADGQRNFESLPETLRIVYALQAKYIEPIIERRIARVRAEERERCAKVVEREILAALLPGDGALQAETHRKQIAAAIRAMGDE